MTGEQLKAAAGHWHNTQSLPLQFWQEIGTLAGARERQSCTPCGIKLGCRVIYLDHNATTPILPEVREAMLPFLSEEWGNPSSSYRFGSRLKSKIEQAREQVADLVGAKSPREFSQIERVVSELRLAARSLGNSV